MAEITEDDYIELAAALEMHRALHIVAEVAALPVGGKDADAPTPFHAGYQLACEEIAERIRTQQVIIPGGLVLPQCGTLPSIAQPAPAPAAAYQGLPPAASLKWDHDGQGGYYVEMRVNSIRSESQAHAAMAYMERLFCGAEQPVN